MKGVILKRRTQIKKIEIWYENFPKEAILRIDNNFFSDANPLSFDNKQLYFHLSPIIKGSIIDIELQKPETFFRGCVWTIYGKYWFRDIELCPE